MSDQDSAPKSAHPTYTNPAIKWDTDQQVWLGNPHLDNMMTMMIALSAEVWASRQRAAILEKLLAAKGVVASEAVERYSPTEEEYAGWEAERQAMAERIFKVAVSTPSPGAATKPKT